MMLGRHAPASCDHVWLLASRGVETRVLRRHFKLQTMLYKPSKPLYALLSSAAVRDHLPYPADMSGARTAKHHDSVLCCSGFFVPQCSSGSIILVGLSPTSSPVNRKHHAHLAAASVSVA